ncbi:hypothetical protein, partial [Palleronia sp.]|uniref:hypothetical protein n=1 Tax=Palleronia sp. TaxID=1940284 RepID=UPI0035C78C7A
MPRRIFALILVLVILAAGVTVWIASAATGTFGGAGFGALALPALLAWGLVRLITSRRGPR